MARKITDVDKTLIEPTRMSWIVSCFGYSKIGSEYGRLSISIDDPLYVKCNFNYCNGDKYVINLKDNNARKLVCDVVNDLPLYRQNPDVYLGLASTCLAAFLVCLEVFLEGGALLPIFIIVLILLGIITISSNVTLVSYRKIMRQCAFDICENYYTLQKEKEERDEIAQIVAQRVWYDKCPTVVYHATQ